MNRWEEFLTTLTAFALVALPALIGLVVLWVKGLGKIFPLPRLRIGNWTGNTILGQLFLYYVSMLFTLGFFTSLEVFQRLLPEDASELRKVNLLGPLANAVFLAASFTWLFVVHHDHIGTVGLSWVRWRQNVFLGLAGFLIVTPVVTSIYLVCLMIFQQEKNPFQLLIEQKLHEWEWWLIFFQAVVFAPLLEEWIFRGLLQGWLRRATLLGHICFVWITLGLLVIRQGANPFKNPSLWLAFVLAGIYGLGAFLLFRPLFLKGLRVFLKPDEKEDPSKYDGVDPLTTNLFAEESSAQFPWSTFGPFWGIWKHRLALWSIFGSSLAFALAHDPWPTPIPLFFFALAVGWLAYRTQSLIPGLVIHSLFNLVAFLVLHQEVPARGNGNADIVALRPSASATIAPGCQEPRFK